jgi:hypothetical protein
MKRTLIAILIACASTGTIMAPAFAQDAAASTSASKPAAKKATKKKTSKKAAAAPKVVDEDEKEPDVVGSTVTDYQCELGNKITIFQNKDDANHIALKWGKRLHRMDRVDTTTGANRFENRHYGLVWIGIPAKGMLLDSRAGHQLANDCKDAEQRMPKPATAAAASAPVATKTTQN